MKYRLKKDLPFAKAGEGIKFLPSSLDGPNITYEVDPENGVRIWVADININGLIEEGWIEEVQPAKGGHTFSSQKDIEIKQDDIVRIPRTGEIKVVAFTDDFGRVWFKENCIGISCVEKLTEEEVSRFCCITEWKLTRKKLRNNF